MRTVSNPVSLSMALWTWLEWFERVQTDPGPVTLLTETLRLWEDKERTWASALPAERP